jgi:hypothetical protein
MGPIGDRLLRRGVFLVVGCFLDAIPAIIIVGTILQPLARWRSAWTRSISR